MDGHNMSEQMSAAASNKLDVVSFMGAGARRTVLLASAVSAAFMTGRVEHVGSFVLEREPGDEPSVARLKLSAQHYVLVHPTAGRYSRANPDQLTQAVLSDIAAGAVQLMVYLLQPWQVERLDIQLAEFGRWGKDAQRHAWHIVDALRIAKNGATYNNMSLEPALATGEVVSAACATALRRHGDSRATPPFPVRTAREVFDVLGDQVPGYGLIGAEPSVSAGPAKLSISDEDVTF
jgi:hypothetical protein